LLLRSLCAVGAVGAIATATAVAPIAVTAFALAWFAVREVSLG
jgi:hypothetical protein